MIILTGTYPPERCCVGDYTQHLLSAHNSGSWTLLYLKRWRWCDLKHNMAQLRRYTDINLNMQYPTMGYGVSLVPHVLAVYAVLFLHKKLYITVHEYSQLGWKGKAALNLLFLFAKDVIFTTSFEYDCARHHNPWMRKGKVVKIRSNIPAATVKPMANRNWDLGYFGYIRPLKGIEDFISVAERLRQQGKRVYVMGQVQPEFTSFHQPLLRELEQKGITYFGNKSQKEVAEMLADTKIMYLSYPDGLSERRGSFLAAVTNGAAVVSTNGAFTSQRQKEYFPLIPAVEAFAKICVWLEDNRWLEKQQQNSLEYAQSDIPKSWEQIVEDYRRIIHD